MDVLVLIDKLDDLVHNAKPVPLTDQVRVDKEEIYDLLDDPARLLDLFRDRRAHLIEDVVDLLAIDANLVGERHGPRVVDQVIELVY